MDINDAIDRLTVVTKELLPESDIPYYRTRNAQILEGFVGVCSRCMFDIEEIKQNKEPEKFLALLKVRLKLSYSDIINLATEEIELLDKVI